MGNRHVSVMIGAPPETVFGLYTDPRRARDWLADVREVRIAGPPDQPGSRAVFAYRWPFKMTAEVLQRGTMRRGGQTFSTNEVFVVHFRDGKISEYWYQPWDQAGVDAWFGK